MRVIENACGTDKIVLPSDGFRVSCFIRHRLLATCRLTAPDHRQRRGWTDASLILTQ